MKFTFKEIKDSIPELGLLELYMLEVEIGLEFKKREEKLQELRKCRIIG